LKEQESNNQFLWQDRLDGVKENFGDKVDELRKELNQKADSLRIELEGKIDKKVSDSTFKTTVQIAGAVIGALFLLVIGTYVWLMGLNQKITHTEATVENITPALMQQKSLLQNSPNQESTRKR